MLDVLVAGDSFAARWPGLNGWVKLLENKFNVTNVAQAGVSEYKILKQLNNVDLEKFDLVIVSHTSFSRVHTPAHPIHKTGLHQNCDLFWADIENRNTFLNPSLKAAKDYFKYHYDDEYYKTVYKLFREDINKKLITKNYISLSHIVQLNSFIIENNHIDCSNYWQMHKGDENHYSKKGNKIIFDIIVDYINKIYYNS